MRQLYAPFGAATMRWRLPLSQSLPLSPSVAPTEGWLALTTARGASQSILCLSVASSPTLQLRCPGRLSSQKLLRVATTHRNSGASSSASSLKSASKAMLLLRHLQSRRAFSALSSAEMTSPFSSK